MGFELNLNQIANIVILISAFIIAVKNIYAFLKKPVDDLKENARQDEEEHVEEILKREMPTLLKENCKTILGALDELKDMTMTQEA
mgnify:CR=1 FL=1